MLRNILILGAGKIACGLANAMPAGSSIVLSSRTRPEKLAFRWISLDQCLEETPPELVILATAWPMANAYRKVSNRIKADVPVLSVVKSASLEELRAIFGNRPLARFLCSVAASDPESLRFFDQGSSTKALEVLKDVLPAADWKSIPSDRFERYGQLLACSAAHCATLHFLSEWLNCSDRERAFLGETLMEAYRLLNEEKSQPLGVLEQSMTPGGNTEALCRKLFRQGDELSETILARRSSHNQSVGKNSLEQEK